MAVCVCVTLSTPTVIGAGVEVVVNGLSFGQESLKSRPKATRSYPKVVFMESIILDLGLGPPPIL